MRRVASCPLPSGSLASFPHVLEDTIQAPTATAERSRTRGRHAATAGQPLWARVATTQVAPCCRQRDGPGADHDAGGALGGLGGALVVVGGTARHLRGEQWLPLDLDIVLDGRASSVEATASALACLGAVVPMWVQRRRSWSIETSLGPLDVLGVMPTSALPAAVTVDVAGVDVPVEAGG